jgi:hypothetical protein
MFASKMMMGGKETEEMKTRCELREKGAIHLNRKDVAYGTKSTKGKLGKSENRYHAWRVTGRDTEEYVGVHTRRKVERIKQKGEPKQKW